MKADGKIYEFGKLNEAMPQYIMVIRQDWLKKLNLQTPKTTEELYQVAKAFAENDPDGNGKKDTYGMNIGVNLYEIFGAGYDKILTSYTLNNGQLSREWSNFKGYVEFAKRLFDEGIIDKDFITDKNGAKARQDFLNGKTGIYLVQANSYQLWTRLWITDYATLKTNSPGADITVIPYPKSPNGQFIPGTANPVQMTAVVNREAKDPKAVMEYIDFLSKPEAGTTLISGLEGVHWNKGANGCPNAINLDKNKTEIGYLSLDFDMVYSVAQGGKCSYVASNFNVDKPEEKFAKDMFKTNMNQYYELIFEQKGQYPAITHAEHFPTVPKELLVDSQNAVTEILNILTKSIISGPSYTPDKAVTDAQAAWDKFSGKKIDEFYKKWYTDNKDNAFLPQDIFNIVKEQRKVQEEIFKQ